jgi:Mrp family chromosome partitioning ATPase
MLATGCVTVGALPRSRSLRHGHIQRSDNPTVEAASRRLVTALLARLPHGRGFVLVTAARKGAGTSTVSEVLAFTAALDGRKVVLVQPVRRKARDHGAPGFVEVLVPEPPSGDRRDDEGTSLGLQEAVLNALDRFDIAVVDAPPILEGRWRRDAAGLADCVVLVASAGDLVDRVRTAAVLASSLAASHLVAIGNRMPWGMSASGHDERPVEGEESRTHPLFGVPGGGAESAGD